MKRGKLTKYEEQFIEKMKDTVPHTEIARQLDRSPDFIRKYCLTKKMAEPESSHEFTNSPYYYQILKQFSQDEITLIIYHWNEIMKQFKGDVLHSEELQILEMCRLEVLNHRILTTQRTTELKIKEIQEELEREHMRANPDEMKIANMKQILFSLFGSINESNKQYQTFLKEKSSILEKLKATREQRIKEIESSKETLVGWFRQLEKDPEYRKTLGLEIEKFRIAQENEYRRLSQYHTYANGEVDRPILNAENE